MRQGAQGWCTEKTQRDGMGREVEGGFRMGNACTPMADSCECMAKPIQYCKVKKKKKNQKSGTLVQLSCYPYKKRKRHRRALSSLPPPSSSLLPLSCFSPKRLFEYTGIWQLPASQEQNSHQKLNPIRP